MSERILAGSPIVERNGALETTVSFYKGHLGLVKFENMNGTHTEGWSGPETRIVSKRLMAHIVGDTKQTIEQPINIPETLTSEILEANQEAVLIS